MKNSTKNKGEKPGQLVIAVFILMSVLIASCSKNAEMTTYSYLSISNLSPTLYTYNIYLDGVQTNTSGAVSFGGSIGYSTILSGDHTLKFTSGSSTDALLNKSITLDEDGIYSAFLIDKAENMDILLVKDEISEASTEKAFIRFINLSPDAPTLDLSVADGETLISNKDYKSASSFQAIDPKTYSFWIKNHITGIVTTELTDQTLSAGKYYTIISKGMITSGDIDQPFGAQMIINL